jgi:cobalt/nickel transport system permease protein
LHHVTLDRWSRGASSLHRRDARAKILALLVFLIVLATTPAGAAVALTTYSVLLIAAILIARLPLIALLLRAAIILPFSLIFGLMSWLAGEPSRALALIEKSYLAAVAALLLGAVTPLPSLLSGIEKLGAPQLLVAIAQFLYRYLFIVSEQAQHMRLAASCRAGNSRHKLAFRAASGMLAVLFARSYQRAEGIHRAMQARAFSGRFALLNSGRFGIADGAFLLAVSCFLILVRLG